MSIKGKKVQAQVSTNNVGPNFDQVRRFWQSPKVEQALVSADIESSIAHVRMLGATGIVHQQIATDVVLALEQLRREFADGGSFLQPGDADIHTGIQRRLEEIVGELAPVLNVAKSHNDHIATDIRLWLRDAIIDILNKMTDLRQLFLQLAERDQEAIMPGYTHMQPALPILLSHWWLANEARVQRDFARLMDCYKRLNVSPLGSGQLAGSKQPIDRDMTAKALGFDQAMENSLDAVSDRDYVVEFTSFAALLGTHLSQMSSELLLWSTNEFAMVRLPRAFVFRSQSMPQKRNPEMLEILRSRPSAVIGRLTQFLTELKGLPLSYCHDLQESLPALLETVNDIRFILELTMELLPALHFDTDRMRYLATADLTNASNVVDYLVERGISNDKSAKIVESLVNYCRDRNRQLMDLTLNEWALFHPGFDEQIYTYLNLEESIDSRSSFGGTATEQVENARHRATLLLENERKALSNLAAKRLNCLDNDG
ncbi:MAG: argininosuccinate lyase [Candidatus Obscuribacterales bacterium]|nr:argininosuccinate lyase [Candidatus Obscuribacterales bacterium]